MSSPFKLLDAYEAGEASLFFGRKEEIDRLYEMVFKSSLILIYGYSGTGKTSLVQCGLSSKFDGPDWFPLFIRKRQNIVESLYDAFRNIFPKDEEFVPDNLAANVQICFEEYLRPFYLIIDQFEELYLLGEKEEQENFIREILNLLKNTKQVKVILVMREEFLGQLYFMEKSLPDMLDFRLRVEYMGRKKIKEVITGNFNAFGLSIEKEESAIDNIYKNLSSGKTGIQLPYLQVYMDRLYNSTFSKHYPTLEKQIAALSSGKKQLPISLQDIEEQGKIENVMKDFLERQMEEIKQEVLSKYQDLPKNTLDSFLYIFITQSGTKKPIYFDQKEELIQLEKNSTNFLPKQVDTPIINELIKAFSKRRILRLYDNYVELAHDSLAYVINEEIGKDQRLLHRYYNRILDAAQHFKSPEDYLRKNELQYINTMMEDLEERLDDNLIAFVKKSEAYLTEQEERKLKKLRRDRRNAWIITFTTLFLFVVSIVFFLGIQEANRRADKEALGEKITQAEKQALDGNFSLTFNFLNEALTLARNQNEINRIEQLRSEWQELEELIKLGRTAEENSLLFDARNHLEEARKIKEYDYIVEKIDLLSVSIKDSIAFYIIKANSNEERANDPEDALKTWEDLLLKFDPQNVEAQENITRLKNLLGRN